MFRATFLLVACITSRVVLAALPLPSEDTLWVYDNGDAAFDVGQALDDTPDAYFWVDSVSAATMSVSGLPPGVSFDPARRTFSGAPTKAGVYYVSVSAQNGNGFKHSVIMRWIVGDADAGDYDNIDDGSGWLDELDGIWTGQYFEWACPVNGMCLSPSDSAIASISGIPDGLAWNASTGLLSGIPTKPGKYTLTLTDSSKKKAVKTVIVLDGGSAFYDVAVSGDCACPGTVIGGGVYSAGQVVRVKATPGANCAFARWQSSDGFEVSEADYSFVADGSPMRLEAWFVHASEDFLSVWCDDGRQDGVWTFFAADDWFAPFGCDSGSAYKMSVTGLPDGLKFDPERGIVFGQLSKSGLYYVTISASNANGYRHSDTMRWFVGDVSSGDCDDIGIDTGAFDNVWMGQWFEWEGPVGVSVTGLPAGLSRNASTGVISGRPMAAGKFTVTFTDSSRQKAVKTGIVRDSGCAYLNVRVADECLGLGTVSGSGVYPVGTSVRLGAVAAKDAAFMYWDNGDDASAPNATYVVGGPDTVSAYFISAANDYLHVYADDVWHYVGDFVENEMYVGLDSASVATMAISGLPAGIVFDKSTKTFVGTLTKQGVYRVSVSASNANGYKATAAFRWYVGNAETGEYPPSGDSDDIGFDLSAFDGLRTGEWFEWGGAPEVSLSGLPDGLVRNARTGLVSGIPTKPGFFTITATDSSRRKSVRTVRVLDGGSVYVTATVAEDCTGLGTVSGSTLATAGGKVTVKAVASANAAFAGWYRNGELLSSEATCTFSAGTYNETVEARFVAAADDWLWVDGGDQSFERGVRLDAEATVDWFFSLDSGSAATLAISGLPTGLAYDAKTRAISGTPTKDGVYYVTASAANANGFRHSSTVRWTVGDAQETNYDDIGLDLSPLDEQYTGQRTEWNLGFVAQCAGLPPGLAYDAETGIVSGMPTKAGKYVFTATDAWRNTAEKTFIVRDSGSVYVDVRAGNGGDDCGEVSGAGVYPWGAALSVKAEPAAGSCFAGWYMDYECNEQYPFDDEHDWREQEMTFVFSGDRPAALFARFIAPEDDYLNVEASEEWEIRPSEDGGAIFDSSWFSVDCATLPKVVASGLPAGLAMSGSRLVVADASKLKPGASSVRLTVTTPSGLSETRDVVIMLEFPVLTVTAAEDDYGIPLGTVSGGGMYWAGSKATLKATAAKTTAFAGWYRNGDELLSTSSTFVYTTAAFDEYIEAKFISAENDWLYVEGYEMTFDVKEPVIAELEAYFAIDSGSEASLSVAGLPSGVKFDAKTRTFSGAATKAGVYYVTASAKNANGYAHSYTVRWFVGGAEETDYDNIGLDLSPFDELSSGMPFEWEGDTAVSVKGLPAGLSRNAKTGLVSGTPTKPGKFTLSFTGPSRTSAEKTVIVRDSGSAYLAVRVGEGDEELGEATGSGVYAIGSKVKIAAKSAKSCYFAGWHQDYGCADPFYDAEGDWRSAGLSVSVSGPTSLFAKFITADEDYLFVDADEEWYVEINDDGNVLSDEFPFYVESATLPTVTASGLPAGISLSGRSLVVSSPSKLAPGVSDVTLTAKNLTGRTGVARVKVHVPNLRAEAFASAGLDDWYELPGGVVSDDMSGVFGALSDWGWKVSVSGLPAGVKFDAKNGFLFGTATKAGSYTVYFTATRGREKQVATATFEVVLPVLELATGYWSDESASGTVSGGGAYPAGTKVTLKATPAKGCVFAGWYYDDGATPLEGAMDYRNASYTYVTGDYDCLLVAYFATAEEDSGLEIYIEEGETFSTDDDGSFELDLGDCVRSITVPSIMVKGLPAGLKFDAKANVISGVATKPGKYAVTVSATNASVKKAIAVTFWIVVPNITSPYLTGLDPDENAYRLATGIVSPDGLLDLSAEDGWTISGVSGLPAGLKYDARTGAITGTPTKSGTYTVTVAAKNGKLTTSATVTLNVFALPDWAVGTFTGLAVASNDDGVEIRGFATVTVSAAGKISGKIPSLGGTSVTFMAEGFDAASGIGDGDDGWNLYAVATAKFGRNMVEVPISIVRAEAPEGLANAALYVDSEIASAELRRTMWGDKARTAAAKAALQDVAGVYTVSLEAEDAGYGYLSMTVGQDGNVKATGKLPDGTAVSVSTPLVYADGVYLAVLSATTKAYKGGDASLVLQFDTGSLAVSSDYGVWSSFDPTATWEYGAGFVRSLSANGSFYDKGARLSDYYSTLAFSIGLPELEFGHKYTWYDEDLGKKVTESEWDWVSAEGLRSPAVTIDAKGTSFVVPKATKPVQDKEFEDDWWLYEGANDGALTLSFTQATGIFKGSYTFWFDYESACDDTTETLTMSHTSKTVSFEGVWVQNDGFRGFFLWDASAVYDDAYPAKSHVYKQSFSVLLN